MREWERKHIRLVELCDQEGEARAELENHDNIKSTVIALAMREAETLGHKSAAAQRREADAGDAYRQWCVERFAAAKVFHGAHLRRLAALTWFDMARSEESSRRAEMTYQ
jgi:hypothetical protein